MLGMGFVDLPLGLFPVDQRATTDFSVRSDLSPRNGQQKKTFLPNQTK